MYRLAYAVRDYVRKCPIVVFIGTILRYCDTLFRCRYSFAKHPVVPLPRKADSIDCAFERTNQHVVVANAQKWMGTPTPEWLDDLLTNVLKHVTRRGQRVALTDCVVLDCVQTSGAYFARMHTDYQWGEYPQCDGFQLWFLVKNDKPAGNMLLLDSPQQRPEFTPSFVDVVNDEVIITPNPAPWATALSKSSRGKWDPEFPLKYVDIEPNDCLLMGQHLWHMSDVRTHGKGRTALHLRVILRRDDGSIPCRGNLSTYDPRRHYLEDTRLYGVGRYDMSGISC